MKLKQIVISIENSPNRLYRVIKAMSDSGINLRAMNLVDTGAFGQLRLLVSDVVKARKILMKMNIPAFVNEVIAAEIEDKPGSLAGIMLPLMQADIRIEFMYAYIGGTSEGKAVMIFRFSDNGKAIDVLQQHGVKILDAKTFNITEQE
ncbi:amino acid-binding protein [Desulfosarcina ovata subsp. sediminis]|uniref:Amino acid-binding protein n=1 Tax=Desulfosarcina ovata subsp. sediminis TaxID=885957 RepID=A0A5K7ZGC8_9BACT|nr:amino acid-binding protein [Desulfosarcina ovata]BBO81142.1 amino acid-binding protein [Desulfosarcina ovata subsp. sediminis]